MSETKTGTIKRIVKDRGFGFIRNDEDHDDLFFHLSELVGVKFEQLEPGMRVAYFIGERKGRKCCLDVVVECVPEQASKESEEVKSNVQA